MQKNMATVVQIEDVNVESMDFIWLRKIFNGNFLLLKWENETKVYMILNLLDVSAYSIKGMCYEVSSDYFVKHRKQFSIFLSLDASTFVCHHDKLYKMLKLLHKGISRNTFVTGFMRFDRDSFSVNSEKKNKNDDEKYQLFAPKLFNEMQRWKHLCGTAEYISDKLVCSADSTHRKNKTCSLYKLDDIPYITHISPIRQTSFKKRKALSPRSVVDVTRKSVSKQPFDLPAVPGAPTSEDISNCSLPFGNKPDLPPVPEHGHSNGGTETPSPRSVSRNILTFNVSQNDSRSEICIDGSSYNRTGQSHFSGRNFDTNFRLLAPDAVQQNRTLPMGHIEGSISGQQQQYQRQNRETAFSELARRQAIPQQRNRNDDLVRHLGQVRSPQYADLTDRLATFTRWPSDIAQTSARVAEAGFYYTGFQDTVRCFACDGGLKNWDPDDDPWIEHARWFPQCAFVRHIKGEEFINLVRMSTEESDEEDDHTVHAGAAWGGANNSNTSADSASREITEPSVLESKDAQFVIEMGFSKKVVAMAINDIFKKGKEDFTRQEITDIILEKDMLGEPSTSILAVDCPATIENVPPTEHAMFENKRLKELLQCTECKTKQRNILFLPCTHHVVCELCSRDLHICTYCYRKIKDKVRTYMS